MMANIDETVDQLQQQLIQEQRERAEIERELAVMHQFIRTAGHDLKTPITTLKTSLYLLQRKPELATQDRLSMMEGQLERLSHLVEAMGLMARLDSQSELDWNESNILPIVHEAIWGLADTAQEKDITLTIDAPEFIPELRLNFEEFKRALINLLDNAVRYTPTDGNVTIAMYDMHGYFCVDVIDTGVGLSPEEVDNLFQRFYRGDDAGKNGDLGAGMGLAIVKRIVELHDGKVRVTSEEGTGSCFRIMLPINN